MDDEDEARSQSESPPTTHATSVAPPYPNGRAIEHVTVAAHPQHTLTLALPIQQTRPASSGGGGGGGGREDCWSEGATSALIDAWGERFLELSRGNLKQKHWQEVADAVSSRDDYTKPPKTDVQCKNRIDTLKKKYKLEKSKISGAAASLWPFFQRLEHLMGPILKTTPKPTPAVATPAATPINLPFPQRQRTPHPSQQNHKRKKTPPPSSSSAESSDDLPPPPRRRRSPVKGRGGLRELARAIMRFAEVYEKAESSKIQQAMEMEKQRLGFSRELELQRMQFFMKTQMELSQVKARHGSSKRKRATGGGGGGFVNNNNSDDNNSNSCS